MCASSASCNCGIAFANVFVMKKLVFVLILFSFAVFAEEDTLHIHLFPNGSISTIITMNNGWGKAVAYNQKGEVIYEREVRRVAGSASVVFKHHANGVVSSAYYSSYPDAGIQWYKSYTDFDKAGNITADRNEDHESFQRVIVPSTYSPPIKEKKQEKEIVECASIHENKTLFINHTSQKISLSINYQGKKTTYTINAGEKLFGPSYISAEISSPINSNLSFEFSSQSRRKKTITTLIKSECFEHLKTTHTVHFFETTVAND